MFDRRLANLEREEPEETGKKWQPLTSVAGVLVEQSGTGNQPGSGSALNEFRFEDSHIETLLAELQKRYDDKTAVVDELISQRRALQESPLGASRTESSPKMRVGSVANSTFNHADTTSEFLSDNGKEHKDSMYNDFLDSVIAEIEDNEAFISRDSAQSYGSSPKEKVGFHFVRTPNAKASKSRKISQPSASTKNFSPSHSNRKVQLQKTSSISGEPDESEQASRLIDGSEDYFTSGFPAQTLPSGSRERVSTSELPETPGDEDSEEFSGSAILEHPVVQALLSEEKVKRWALLRSLYEREASLESQIAQLKKDLKDQTQLANHYRRMQQEMMASQEEKENVWERERQKLISKLRSGHEKLRMCSKLILHLEKDRREKNDKIQVLLSANKVTDENKNEVYQYKLLSENETTGANEQSNYLFSACTSNSGFPSQLESTITANQSDLSIISESETLLTKRKSCGPEDFETEQHQSSPPSASFVATELAQVKKLVASCKSNAERQYKSLRQMLPASGSGDGVNTRHLRQSSKAKRSGGGGGLIKSLTLPASHCTEDSQDDGSQDSDEDYYLHQSGGVAGTGVSSQATPGGMSRSKSMSMPMRAGAGADTGIEWPAPLPHPHPPTHHLSNFAVSQPASSLAAAKHYIRSDPFELDLKVKYSSTENLAHALHTCSLTSPLISPCSSFEDGLGSGPGPSHTRTGSGSSVFGSGVILAQPPSPSLSPSSRLASSPLHKESQSSSQLSSRPGHVRTGSVEFTHNRLRLLQSSLDSLQEGGGSSFTRHAPSSPTLESPTTPTVQHMQQQHGTTERSGTESSSRSDDVTTEHDNPSLPLHDSDSLMIFDTTPETHSQRASSVIKDFDPLDSCT